MTFRRAMVNLTLKLFRLFICFAAIPAGRTENVCQQMANEMVASESEGAQAHSTANEISLTNSSANERRMHPFRMDSGN